MANQVATNLYNKLAEEFELRKALSTGGDSVLSGLRQNAFNQFKAKGFPSIKEEDWRFTSLVPFLDTDYNLTFSDGDEGQLSEAVRQAAISSLDAYLVVLENGVINQTLSSLPSPEQVTIVPLREMTDTDFFKEQLSLFNTHEGNTLTALNSAFFSDGYYIEIKKNAVVNKPIEIIHVYTHTNSAFFQPRHMVVVNRNANAEIVEKSVTLGNASLIFVNSVSQIFMEENAQLRHYQIQNNEAGERWLQYNNVIQQRSSRYDNFTFCLPGADLIRNNLEVRLRATATETHLYGLYMVAGNQLTDNHTSIEHAHPDCQSNEMYKGVLMDNGKAVFNGKVFVKREAQKTNAFQQNNNLLLSEKAQIYAKPQLEIFADDVKCSHGCTVGQFDNDSLFYLQSRGISEDAGRKMLVEAFMFDVTEKISNNAVKEHIQQLIYSKMGNIASAN